jgi:hypothetical protein
MIDFGQLRIVLGLPGDADLSVPIEPKPSKQFIYGDNWNAYSQPQSREGCFIDCTVQHFPDITPFIGAR